MPRKATYEELERRVKELEKFTDECMRKEKVFQPPDIEKEAILNNLMEHVVHQDTEMRILWANRAACESVNLTYDELLGRYCYEVWPQRSNPCPDCPVMKAMETNQPQETEKTTPDGRWWFVRGYPLRDSNGNIKGGIEVTLEVTERKQVQDALKKAHDELEHRVKERTKALKDALSEMKRKEKEIKKHRTSLKKVNIQLLETNKALTSLARIIDSEKELLKNKIYNTIVTNVMPVIVELQNNKNCRRCLADLEILKTHLNSLFSDPNENQDIIMLLTAQEMRVATLIKKGMTSKQIGSMLFISEHTVKTHRKNIRKKLKIQNPKVNLTYYLNRKWRDSG